MVDATSARRPRRTTVLALVAAMVAALAACSGSDPQAGSDGAGSPARAAEADVAASDGSDLAARDAAPGAAVWDGEAAQLNVGILGQIPTLNPTENIGAGLHANSLGLETLLRLNQRGELEPWLATEWEAVSDTVYEYTLREGVPFWDGTELTAEDVEFSWQRLVDDAQSFFATVESVEALDRYTVRVNLVEPNASWQYTPALFYGFIYQKAFYDEDPEGFGQPGRLVMGTGPWQIDSLSPTTGMELSAFDDYWGGAPPFDRVSVRSFDDQNAMALALRAGELDFVPLVSQPAGFNAAAGEDVTTTTSTCATALLSMPTQTEPFDDVHVRRAVAHAINRDDIIAARQGAAGEPLTTLIAPLVLRALGTEEAVAAALDSLPTYEYDLEAARAELARSDVPDGFEFEFLTTATYAPVAQVIAAQLSEIGIELSVEQVGDTEFTTAIVGEPSERPLTWSETGACTPDPSWNDIWLGTTPDGAPTVLNVANYTPPEIDELQDAGLSTTDPSERLDIYIEILDMVATDVPYVPLYTEGATYASDEYDLVDFGAYWVNQPWALNLVPK